MRELRRQLKTDARRFLRFHWSDAVLSVLVLGLAAAVCVFAVVTLNYALGLTSPATLFSLPAIPSRLWGVQSPARTAMLTVIGVGVALFLFLIPPLRISRCKRYLQRSYGEEPPNAKPFARLRDYAHTLYVSLYTTLLELLCAAPVLIVCLLCALQLRGGYEQGALTAWQSVLLGGLLALAATVLAVCWLWFVQRWALLPYLAFLRPELSLRQMLRISHRCTQGRRFELTRARLSFLGWGLLCVLVFPILYVLPYYEQTMALYARHLLENQRPEEEQPSASVTSSESVLTSVLTDPAKDFAAPEGANEDLSAASNAPGAPDEPIASSDSTSLDTPTALDAADAFETPETPSAPVSESSPLERTGDAASRISPETESDVSEENPA